MSDDTETVARIWRQLGSPSYEALNGRSIHDLIDGLLADRQRLADIEAAASEAVTEDVYAALVRAVGSQTAADAALRVLGDALIAAGERRGLERAAEIFDRRAGVNAGEAEWSHPDGRHYRGFPNYPAKPLNHAATRYLEAARDAALLRALGRPA